MWLDTAMVFTDPPYLGPTPSHLVGRLGALRDRIVFGSDFPTIPHQIAAQVSGLAALGLGDDWLRARALAQRHAPVRALSAAGRYQPRGQGFASPALGLMMQTPPARCGR